MSDTKSSMISDEKMWNKSFICVFLTSMFLNSSFWTIVPMVSSYSMELGSDLKTASFVVSLMSLTAMLLRPFVGMFSDQVNRKRLIIATILFNDETDFQIIIPPHYGYEAIASSDLYTMEKIFGQERVHDFSHDPALGTDLHYYYDEGHLVARQCGRLIDSAYNAVTLPSPYLK